MYMYILGKTIAITVHMPSHKEVKGLLTFFQIEEKSIVGRNKNVEQIKKIHVCDEICYQLKCASLADISG